MKTKKYYSLDVSNMQESHFAIMITRRGTGMNIGITERINKMKNMNYKPAREWSIEMLCDYEYDLGLLAFHEVPKRVSMLFDHVRETFDEQPTEKAVEDVTAAVFEHMLETGAKSPVELAFMMQDYQGDSDVDYFARKAIVNALKNL